MALLKFKTDPTPSQLRWFALLWFPATFVAIAAVIWFRTGATELPVVLAVSAVVLGLLGAAIRPVGRGLWIGLLAITFPIGFVVSHVMLLLIFYGVITPIGLLMRLLGRDPMARKIDPSASSYWKDSEPPHPTARYFRQF